MVLIADPQLVDPHTYPGRPWPLSTLTVWYTDLYLRRSYRLLQEHLRPDSVFFLGDLFDGGREWGTKTSASPEKRYKRYGHKFWLKEYGRFARLFFRGWRPNSAGSASEPRGHKLVSTLPGNHDLGFANGISAPVKERFETYFGPLNRIDVVGNHTFVSVDTVSLSAMDQVDPATGSSGLGDGTATATARSGLWKPVEEFLTRAKEAKAQAVQHEHMSITGATEALYTQKKLSALAANVTSLSEAPTIDHTPSAAIPAHYPTVLLTHVPLYRPPDTDCGPLRERGHALSITAGYQYQNVLTPLVSKAIVSSLDAEEIAQIYSGDDHDYCEVDHLEFTGRIKEITVKSMSWAMGVRDPGFLAVSLHNPVDLYNGPYADMSTPKDTIQNHLCLLPNQLTIFIRYGQLLSITLIVLAVRALFFKSASQPPSSSTSKEKELTSPLLPFAEPKTTHRNRERSYSSSTKNSTIPSNNSLSTRGNAVSARPSPPSSTPANYSYGYGYGYNQSSTEPPESSRSSSPGRFDPPQQPTRGMRRKFSDDWSTSTSTSTNTRQRHAQETRWARWLREFKRGIVQVAIPVLLIYFWILLSE